MNLSPATEARLDAMSDETRSNLVHMINHITGVSNSFKVSYGAVFRALASVPQAELTALRTPHQLGTLVISRLGNSIPFPADILEESMSHADAVMPDVVADFSEFTLLRELVEDILHPQAA